MELKLLRNELMKSHKENKRIKPFLNLFEGWLLFPVEETGLLRFPIGAAPTHAIIMKNKYENKSICVTMTHGQLNKRRSLIF